LAYSFTIRSYTGHPFESNISFFSFLFVQVEYHKNITEQNLKALKEDEYKFVKYLNVNDDMTEAEARQQAMFVEIFCFLE